MIEDEIISFETAILAKEKRCYIDGCCRVYHRDCPVPDGEESIRYTALVPNSGLWDWDKYPNEHYIIAYTQTTLAKYLREKHKLNVEVNYFIGGLFFYSVLNMVGNNSNDDVKWGNNRRTYEEAMEAGLQEALKMI